jgi:hypothetical protein
MPEADAGSAPARRRVNPALVAFLIGGALLLAGVAFLLVNRSIESRWKDVVSALPGVGSGTKKAASAALRIEYHQDRNALRDSLMVGDRLVALDAAGTLLLFDSSRFNLLGERQARRRFVCIGAGDEGSVSAALSNGAIVRVGLADLSLTAAGEVAGQPAWLGRRMGGAGLLVAFSSPGRAPLGSTDTPGFSYRLKDLGTGREYPLDEPIEFLLDSKDRLWVAGGRDGRTPRLQVINLGAGTMKDVSVKDGWAGLKGVAELPDGQIWAFGGSTPPAGPASFIARVEAGGKATTLWSAPADRAKLPVGAPDSPITQILAAPGRPGVVVVSAQGVVEVDANARQWKAMGSLGFKVQRASRGDWRTVGRAHVAGERIILTLASGGFWEVTADASHRHLLDGQDSVSFPTEIVRMGDGLALYGYGGPLLYANGTWHAVPETVAPPRDLMGAGRTEGEERVWASLVSIPVDETSNVVVAKAGARRWYSGHMHGVKDTFVTGQWQGGVFKVMSQEDLALEPDDTFATPDRQLWNVDNQGLWNFSGGKWRMVMGLRGSSHGTLAGSGDDGQGRAGMVSVKSAVGEPLRFVAGVGPPWIGLPFAAFTWALARLDLNEAGGVPLIDDVPVSIDGNRVQIRDAIAWDKGRVLLATNQGLCLFELRWGHCQPLRPSGLDDEVGVILRDRSKRVWLAGRGLWLLESQNLARPLRQAVPALAEGDVVAMAEAPDGRLALGLAGRGAVILDVPAKWFARAAKAPPAEEPWEARRAFEGRFADQAVMVRTCQPAGARVGDAGQAAWDGLKARLANVVLDGDPRVHLGLESTLDRRPDIGIYGIEADKLEAPVVATLRKSPLWPELGVIKRYGPPGSRAAEIKSCPKPGDGQPK